ncbi:hypothetical protein PQX77_020379 [Marasmius sp. AFHP31]|nr:hypothetical protein PQX77_020379 [Marasmius sp. AFHP31]
MASNEKDPVVQQTTDDKRESASNEQPPDLFHVLDREPTFKDYIHFAALTRSRESAGQGSPEESARKSSILDRSGVEQGELDAARRALRTAGWVSIFYLITTDILGPFNAPFAFSQVGYVPGAILYVVSTICLSNGQAVEQIARSHKFCFSVAIIIWTIVGMIIGQIRTLKNYGWLANSAVWLNLTIIFTSMGFVAHSPPNFESAKAAFGLDPGPVMKSAFVSLPLFSKVNGIMNMVFAYGGAMIFPEFMAEMRRPMDFWKGMVCAQLLISTVYLLYGLYIYSFQGQFTLPLAYQGVSQQAWQDVGNVISVITGIIAAGLYGNIGIKLAYYQIVEGWLHGPPFMSRRGRFVWPCK